MKIGDIKLLSARTPEDNASARVRKVVRTTVICYYLLQKKRSGGLKPGIPETPSLIFL